MAGPASFPWRFALAISSPDVFCNRLRPSYSTIRRRRSASNVATSPRILSASRPRFLRPVRTSSVCSRMNSGSSMILALDSTCAPLVSSATILRVSVSVRKAVFPAAGLGTRFLPATKAQPKEMLPLVDKPIIQYGVEEAVGAGISNIILVTGRGKNAIEDHFDVSVELETFLEARGKKDLLQVVRKISNLINFSYVRQGEPLGLGHAVLVTRPLVGNEPFAVILGDDVIDADPPALKQMIDVFREVDGPVLAIERVPRNDVSSYGIIEADE